MGGTRLRPVGEGGHIIEDEGVPLAQQPALNFLGDGVTAADSPGKTNVTIPGGGGGGFSIFDPAFVQPEIEWWYHDQFFYPVPTFHLPNYEFFATSGGAIDTPQNLIGGQIRILSQGGGAANDITRLNVCGGGLIALDTSKKFKLIWRVSGTNSGGVPGNPGVYILGLSPGGAFPGGVFPFTSRPTPYIQFRAQNGGNWFAQTHDGSTPNSVDTGITYVTGVLHTFMIEYDGIGTLKMSMDGLTVATFTSNIPVGNLAAFVTGQTGGPNQITLFIDELFIGADR